METERRRGTRGRALFPYEERTKHAPAGTAQVSVERKLQISRSICLSLLCALSSQHMAYLTASRKTGASGAQEFDELDYVQEFKSYLYQLFLPGPHGWAELEATVERAVSEGHLPRRIRVPRRSAAQWEGLA